MTRPDPPSTLKPAEVATAFIHSGVAKHSDRYENIFFKAVLAGVMLSFGGLLSEIMSGGSPGLTQSNPGVVRILGGFVFPVGLVMIVLQGQELLTSNMMVFPMAVIKHAIPWWSLPVNWVIVMFGNLVGSLFFGAILVHYSGVMSAEPYASYVKSFAIKKAAEPEWHQIFLRGIGCNWLVCIAVWQAAGARDTFSKVVAIWIPIWESISHSCVTRAHLTSPQVFVACSFDHVVANMFSIPLGIMFGAPLSTAEYIRKSFIAAFLGNTVGALLVALPAVYFYLRDYDHVEALRMIERGEAGRDTGEVHESSSDIVNGKRQ